MSCVSKGITVNGNPIVMLERLRAAAQVLLVLFFILLMLWSVPKLNDAARFYSALVILTWTFALMVMSHINYHEGLEELGFGTKHLKPAVKELALPVIIAAIILVSLGLTLGTIHFRRKFFLQLAGIPIWALFQQYITQSFINRRLQAIFGPGHKSTILTATIFSIVHLPNPTLTLATAIAGYFWARAFQRAPNLYAIAISHGLLSTLFANAMPKWILPNMVVGYNYLVRMAS